MLFLNEFTYKPGKAERVIEEMMREEIPEGIKNLGEWTRLEGGGAFRLIETDSPEAFWKLASRWSNLGEVKVHPVTRSEDIRKLIQK